MIIALTGTPGTGKTSVAEVLKNKGFEIVDLNKVACDNNFIIGKDIKRDSNIVDLEKINKYILENYSGKDFVFVEGHLSHLLKNVEKIVILRCHPKFLKKNLSKKKWNEDKIKENIEAEILDIILCEALELHLKKDIFEINVSDKTIEQIADSIIEIINNNFKSMKKYIIGNVDWSEEILKDY
ncbi:MAG: adenylate kinase family protein [Thermoplasmatales archaeon]|nr:MAG: adenylate kinase family protein [Thermoplasmatales archaeon]